MGHDKWGNSSSFMFDKIKWKSAVIKPIISAIICLNVENCFVLIKQIDNNLILFYHILTINIISQTPSECLTLLSKFIMLNIAWLRVSATIKFQQVLVLGNISLPPMTGTISCVLLHPCSIIVGLIYISLYKMLTLIN